MQTMDAGKGGHISGAAAGITGFITAILMSFVLFVAAAFLALYADPGYYEREYSKYNVLDILPVEMTMSSDDGVLAVSEHMMDYLLHGEEPDDLQIAVTINGETRDFFSEREIAHMADVRFLFRASIDLFFVLLAVSVILNIIAWKLPGKKTSSEYISSLSGGLAAGTLFIIAAIGILAAVICSNFSTAFIKFHHIFFDNDLWMLDPYEDLMINILPENFFADTALRIAILYAVFMVIMLAAAVIARIKSKKFL